jgi:hypothetical protein
MPNSIIPETEKICLQLFFHLNTKGVPRARERTCNCFSASVHADVMAPPPPPSRNYLLPLFSEYKNKHSAVSVGCDPHTRSLDHFQNYQFSVIKKFIEN